ncbi:unnamed protein product [Trichobilharzia szidati]|nr:unnamed protein product [Trichobilharzia szidati]
MVLRTSKKVTVSVIGYPGSAVGARQHVGKSCLISRFLVPSHFNDNHLSVLSLSDFDGEVVCSSHWLYWGDSSVNVDGVAIQIRIIEQCDFVDDHVFQPLFEDRPYAERCLDCKIHLHSRKLSYICKEQLGHESAFPQVYLDPTTLSVDVFVYAYDMSLRGPEALQQAAFLRHVVSRLSSLKLPIVVATTKHDIVVSNEASILLRKTVSESKRSWMKNVCVVETSSRLNINVCTVFQCAAFFGYYNDMKKHKLRNGLLDPILKRALNLRKPFPICFKKSLCSSLRWFEYDMNSCNGNLHSSVSIPSSCQNKDCYIHSIHSGGFTASKSELGISEQFVPSQDVTLTRANNAACGLSVLPAPPSVPLTGPCSLNTIGTIASSSSSSSAAAAAPTEMNKSVSFPNKSTDVLNSTAWGDTVVKIRVHGQSETTNQITLALEDFCPLEHYNAKNGRRFRVMVVKQFSEGFPIQKHTSTTNMLPFYSDPPNRRPICIQPIRTPLNASLMSAFSAPNSSLLKSSLTTVIDGDNDDCHHSNKEEFIRTARVTSSTPKAGNSTSHSLHNPNFSHLSEFYVNLYVHKNRHELVKCCCEQINDNMPNFISQNSTNNCKAEQNSIKVLTYLCLKTSNTIEKRNTIVSGLVFSSRYKFPYFVIDLDSIRTFLNNLLWLVDEKIQAKRESSSSPSTEETASTFIDWRCLVNNNKILTISLLSLNSSVHQTCSMMEHLQTGDSSSLANNHTTITINEDPHFHCKNPGDCFSCSTHFMQLDQVMESFVCQPSIPSTYAARALIIHYASSSWSEIGIHLENSLKKLCSLFESDQHHDAGCIFSLILLVAYHSGSSQQTAIEAEGICHGLNFIQRLAQTYEYPVLLPPVSDSCPAEVEITKSNAEFTSSPSSSPPNTSQVDQKDRLYTPFCPMLCEKVHPMGNKRKPTLSFLSLSPMDEEKAKLYSRIFQGKFNSWLSTSSTSDRNLTHSACSTTTANTENHLSSMLTLKCSLSQSRHGSHTHSISDSRIISSTNTTVVAVSPSNNDIVTLPWLPLSPNSAFRVQTGKKPLGNCIPDSCVVKSDNTFCRKNSNNHRNSSQENGLNSMECCTVNPVLCNEDTCPSNLKSSSLPQIGDFSLTCPQSRPTSVLLSGMNSSVEEYYTELPKVTQSDVFGSESRRTQLNRPKRPYPRIDSTDSHSSSPSLITNEKSVLSSSDMLGCDHSPTKCPGTGTSTNRSTVLQTSDHQIMPDNISTVYAEVNDAFVYNTIPPYHSSSSSASLISSSKAASFVPGKKVPDVDHYDTADYSVEKLTNNDLTLKPVHHTCCIHNFKFCDTMHRDGLAVPFPSNQNCCSDSSHSHLLTNSLSCDKIPSDIPFPRRGSQFNPKLTNLPALPASNEIPPNLFHNCSSMSPVAYFWPPNRLTCPPVSGFPSPPNIYPSPVLRFRPTCTQNNILTGVCPSNSEYQLPNTSPLCLQCNNRNCPNNPPPQLCTSMVSGEFPCAFQTSIPHPNQKESATGNSNITHNKFDLSRKPFLFDTVTTALRRRSSSWFRHNSQSNRKSKP